ncbi:MAG: ubiquinol-cytochrome c reductase iron-sulfur subunit [Dehalococcoidia bacterium]|nr:ubiquinol-cytochrome c reductase iron-sulfur subunit [Dehalococcoidia bacterium]
MSRRSFLDYGIRGIVAFISGVVAVPVIGYIISPAFAKKESPWVQLGQVNDFKADEPKLVEFTLFLKDGWVEVAEKKSAWVVRRGANDFNVFNPRCTHLGCAYNWETDKKQFRSPCHNGIFDLAGKVLGGPPPRSLDTLEYKVEGNQLSCVYSDFRLGTTDKAAL